MAEREWRDASDLRVPRAGLMLVLAAAAVLRLWEIGHGIPHAIGSEEPEIVARAFEMMKAGSFNPEVFDGGHLPIYVQMAVSVLRFLAGSTAGEWHSLASATSHTFYLWGRVVTAAIGIATVLLLFRGAMRWGGRHALLAAALLAVLPLHIRYSQLVVPETLLTFCVTACFVLALNANERRTIIGFAFAGALAGLAAACRYGGALAIVMPLAAAATAATVPARRLTFAGISLASAFGAFLLAAPYTVLQLPDFLNRFAQMAGAARVAGQAEAATIASACLTLAVQAGWPTLVLLAGGLALALVRSIRGPGRERWTVALSYVAAHLWFVVTWTSGEPRSLLPLVPIVCVIAASAAISAAGTLRRYDVPPRIRAAAVPALTAALLLPPGITAVREARNLSRETTRDRAYAWIRANVKANEVVVVEGNALSIPRGVVSGRGIAELRQKTREQFAQEGVQYLVASSDVYGRYLSGPPQYRHEYADYMRLFTEALEVARFTPAGATPGPELRVLRVVP